MVQDFFATKICQSQAFDEGGKRLTITRLRVSPATVLQVKTEEKDGYQVLKIGFREVVLEKLKKPAKGIFQKTGLKKGFRVIKELWGTDLQAQVGDQIKFSDVFKNGDLISVASKSRGKGFTGVMKRWGFAGGPRTHGQSDRQRSPGSIGGTTTPGRVVKGKKMPGRSGGQTTTIQRLKVLQIDEAGGEVIISGLVPGSRGSLIRIRKSGQVKNFVPLLGTEEQPDKTKKIIKKKA